MRAGLTEAELQGKLPQKTGIFFTWFASNRKAAK